MPVTKVLLFSSGVGYFEHAGAVRGNSATELRFKTNQINDILKSIVLQDQDGGHVGAITYPSQDPLAKTLKSFQVDITKNPSLADLLNQLRGARVTLAVAGRAAQRHHPRRRVAEEADGARRAWTCPVLNLLAGATIRSVELQSITSLSLDDPQLQDELTKALAALVQARDQDKKPVTINFTGAGERRVRIGYVVETPVWKTSYRLLLGDKTTTEPAAGLGDRGEPDGERLEQRVALARERAADLVHDGSLSAALRNAADGGARAVRRACDRRSTTPRRRRTRSESMLRGAVVAAGWGRRERRSSQPGVGRRHRRRGASTKGERRIRRCVHRRTGRVGGEDGRAVSVRGAERHAGAPEVGDAADRRRQHRARARVDLQPGRCCGAIR